MSIKERDQYSGNNICTREQKEYGDATDRGFKKVINPFISYLVFMERVRLKLKTLFFLSSER